MKCLSLLISMTVVLTVNAISEGLIDISYAGYTISQPGAYIVVADLHAATDQNGITIETSNVSIDLNGHTLYGAGTTAGSTGNGINGLYNINLTVKNGIIRDFREFGILFSAGDNKVMHIQAYGNKYTGIANYNGEALIQDCCSVNNGDYGFVGSDGSIFINNISHNNGSHGILTGGNCIVTGNTAFDNANIGIYSSFGCTMTGNSVFNNGGDGIQASDNATISGNSARSNGRFGIFASSGSTLIGNSAYNNDSTGICVYSGCDVNHNTCRANYGSGIQTTGNDNSISQNVCTLNFAYGLLSGSGNYFEQNKLSGNGTNESLGGSTEGAGDLANVIF